MTGPRTLSSEEVAGYAGITYRKLDYWCRAGYLRPGFTEGDGVRGHSGRARRWDDGEALAAICMGQLANAGLAPAVAARLVRGLQAGRARQVRSLAEGIMLVYDVPLVPHG